MNFTVKACWGTFATVTLAALCASAVADDSKLPAVNLLAADGAATPGAAEAPRSAPADFAPTAEPRLDGIENPWRLTPHLYSGGEPHGDADFAKLEKLGVRTIVSVDGARPDLDVARRHGMHYVHVPIGYDGLPQAAQWALTRVGREAKGPIYVHCHHGQHRGPAAAAIVCQAASGINHQQAQDILKLAGTGKQYGGLWRDVAGFVPPALDQVLPELVEAAHVSSLAEAMAALDRQADHLGMCMKAGWKAPPEHPDLAPAQEALLVREGLHEARRLLSPQHAKELGAAMSAAEKVAAELQTAIEANEPRRATSAYEQLRRSCTDCHKKHRDK